MSEKQDKTVGDQQDDAPGNQTDQLPEPAEEPAADKANAPAKDVSSDNGLVERTAPPVTADSAAASVGPADVRPSKGSSVVAWLAILLVLLLAAAAGWSLLEAERREAALLARLAEVEVVVANAANSAASAAKDAANAANSAANEEASLESLAQDWKQQLAQGLGELRTDSSQQAGALQSIEAQLAEQRAELERFNARDRGSWLMAEAEYLLRLANQRLILAGDTAAAQALLGGADDILRTLDDAGLHQVRGAVAADLAAVRAVPKVDIEGLYLRLSALVEQAGKLVIFELPEQELQPREGAAQDWQDRLRQGYEDALVKLSDYVAIRRRDVPMQALMDPQWEGLVRQNLRMLLEQAQVALLSGNQSLYGESLQRAQHWVGEFFESDEAAARAMAREITQLSDATVAVNMPDISRSLRALDEAIKQRLQQGGVE